MGLKSFNPYTASRRFITVLDKSHITKETPEKALLEPKKRSGGRNNHGEIVIWHRGGGHKQQYRQVDFRRDKVGVPARSRPSSTTPIAARTSRCCTTPTARSVTSCTPWVWKSARPYPPAKARTFFREMRCRSGTFRRAPWCTTWSCIRDAAGKRCARPAERRNC